MNITPKEPSGLTQLILNFMLMILSGLTIMQLWYWYIVPLGLPAINLLHAMGIDLLVSFMVTTQINLSAKTGSWEHFTYGFIFALMTLLFGWVFTLPYNKGG